MKKLFLTAFLSVSMLAFSQDYSVPAASPRQKVEQQFSISKIAIDYGRPAVKGRKIFGELVPYGKVWRAGANGATKITFGQAITFGGKDIAAGTYALFILPTEKDWKIILNKDALQWGAYAYDEKLNVAEITVPIQKLDGKKEYFEIMFHLLSDQEMSMVFAWDTIFTEVPIKIAKPEMIAKMAEKLKETKQIERDAAAKK